MTTEVTQEPFSIRSPDGTEITCFRSGQGSPLVLVHGTTADHTRWAALLSALGQRFTVYAMDRRGRGASGDSEPYAVEREFEDVAAVADAIERPVTLLGHSFGGLVVLEGVHLTTNVERLVVYEGVVLGEDVPEIYPPGSIERLESLLNAGRPDEAVGAMMREIVGLPADQIDLLRTLPAWQARVAAADTIPRELRADRDYEPDPRRLRAIRVPTIFLVGGESPQWAIRSTEALAAEIPGARIEIMPGQHHAAMDTGPEVFLQALFRFAG